MKHRLADPYIDQEQLALVNEILLSKKLVHGEYCEKFEQDLGAYLKIEHENVAVTSSCTASLHLALMALEIGVGHGVMVPDFTFPATVNVVERVGATPIFVDVDPTTYTMNPDSLRQAIQKWHGKIVLKAIIVVHEFGAMADMLQINQIAKENNLLVIEDAACAFGSTLGESFAGLMADVGCYSFHPRKALTTGEGGAVVSRNREITARVKVLRNHGMKMTDHGMDFVEPGLNYRLTNFQAALGMVQLKYFSEWILKRRNSQCIYRERITSRSLLHPLGQPGHSWQSYMVVLADAVNRDQVIKKLREYGIETNFGAHHVLGTAYYHNKYSHLYEKGMPVAQRLFQSGLCLPLHQGMESQDFVEISDAVTHILETTHANG